MTKQSSKKSRFKSKLVLMPIGTWEDADHMVRMIGDLSLEINKLNANAKATIDAAKEKLFGEVENRAACIDLYTRSLEAFAASHQADFGDARSKKLNFGTLGWRKSTCIRIARSTLEKIREVFGKKAEPYIRLKEEVDKEAVGKLTDEQLAAIAAKREVEDTFFIEPAIPEAKVN